MWKLLLLSFAAVAASFAEPAEEWEPFHKSGLFRVQSPLWVAPDMEKETVAAFTGRLLDGARQGDAKAMATLGRFFFVRGDVLRAAEWLGKAAEAGHGGAQLDFGMLCLQGQGVASDPVEAYKWIWLATWADAPGADGALLDLSSKLKSLQILDGVKKAAAFQDAHKKPAGSK